jgi:hypothetical protein
MSTWHQGPEKALGARNLARSEYIYHRHNCEIFTIVTIMGGTVTQGNWCFASQGWTSNRKSSSFGAGDKRVGRCELGWRTWVTKNALRSPQGTSSMMPDCSIHTRLVAPVLDAGGTEIHDKVSVLKRLRYSAAGKTGFYDYLCWGMAAQPGSQPGSRSALFHLVFGI